MKTKNLEIEGALLNSKELCNYLEKKASNSMVSLRPKKNTYPVPRLL